MSLVRRAAGPEVRTGNVEGLARLLELRGLRRGASGTRVDADSAMRLSTVWRCVNLISDLVSTLPIECYHEKPGGERTPMPAPSLIARPSAHDSPITWRRNLLVSLLLKGNAYGMVTATDGRAHPTSIELLNPDLVTWRQRKAFGSVEWRVLNEPVAKWPDGPLWHLPAYTVPGCPVGLSPIAYGAVTMGLGLSAQEFASGFFTDGAHPTGILTSDKAINQEDARTIKDRFMAALHGRREPAVLGAGMTYHQVQVNPEESQFLDTIKANRTDVANFFGVPPELAGGEAGGSLTYSNVEQRALDLLTYCIGPWVAKVEEAWFMLTPRPQTARHNLDALLRVDAKTRADVTSVKVRTGVINRNEARAQEDLPPIGPEGDEYLWPPFSTSAPKPAGSSPAPTPPPPALPAPEPEEGATDDA